MTTPQSALQSALGLRAEKITDSYRRTIRFRLNFNPQPWVAGQIEIGPTMIQVHEVTISFTYDQQRNRWRTPVVTGFGPRRLRNGRVTRTYVEARLPWPLPAELVELNAQIADHICIPRERIPF